MLSGCRPVDELIHARDEAGRRHVAFGRDDPQRRLHDRHNQSGGDALSRHVGQRDAERAVTQLDEIVVVAADAAGRNTHRGEIGTVDARRGIGQQAALDVRRQGDVAAQRFLFDDPIGQPRVFNHQRELIGACAQHLFLVGVEAGAVRTFAQQQYAQDLGACAQRHGQADTRRGERANLVEPVRTVRRGPIGEGVEFIRRKRHRQRIGAQPRDQESVGRDDRRGRFERTRGDEAAVVRRRAVVPLEQRGRFDLQLVHTLASTARRAPVYESARRAASTKAVSTSAAETSDPLSSAPTAWRMSRTASCIR